MTDASVGFGEVDFFLQLWVGHCDTGYEILATFENQYGGEIVETYYPINFCPKCGKDLRTIVVVDKILITPELCKVAGKMKFSLCNTLLRNGIRFLNDFEKYSLKDIQNLRHVGPKSVDIICKLCEEHGIKLKE